MSHPLGAVLGTRTPRWCGRAAQAAQAAQRRACTSLWALPEQPLIPPVGGAQTSLWLSLVLLEQRAPGWAALLRERCAAAASAVGAVEAAAEGAAAAEAEAAAEGAAAQPLVWRVSPAQAGVLGEPSCRCLYRLAASGSAAVAPPLTSRALVEAARELGCVPLLLERPLDAAGRRPLQVALARAADPPSLGCEDVCFELPGGEVVHAHRSLLAARSEYFERMLRWDEGASAGADGVSAGADGAGALPDGAGALPEPPPRQRVRVCSGSSRSFRLLLRHVYSGHALAGSCAPDARPLSVAHALELCAFGRLYMLPSLVEEARPLVAAAMSADEFVPALLLCQEQGAEDEAQAVFEWAVAHYDEVVDALERGGARSSLIDEDDIRALREQLRAAMLQARYGL